MWWLKVTKFAMFFSVGLTQEVPHWTRKAELVWFIPVCCRRKGRSFDLVLLWRWKEQHQPQSHDSSRWIQQAEKMCLLKSDRADAAPFSQLMLLLPSISISAADWADMWLNFLPGARVLSLRAVFVNILWEIWLCKADWWLSAGRGSWGCPWPLLFLYPFQFIIPSIPRTEPPTEF